MIGRIELGFFLHGGFLRPVLQCVFKKIPISPTLAVLRSLWNVVPSSGLRKFRHGISIVVVTLDAQRDKLDRRSSTKLTVPATVDGEFFVDLCLQHDSLAWIHLFNGSAVSAISAVRLLLVRRVFMFACSLAKSEINK